MPNKFLFDLLYHDGPLTSVFEVTDGLLEIWDWQYLDADKNAHVWLRYNTTPENLKRFIRNEINSYELVTSGMNHFKVVLDGQIEIVEEVSCPITEIPKNESQFDYMFAIEPDTIKEFVNA